MTLVAFDFDGTLSNSEMTVLLGEQRGVADEMAKITERAMNDKLAYAESLRRRVGLLDGLSEAQAQAAFNQVRLRSGAGWLLNQLRAAGNTVVILTGGFERGVAAALAAAGVEVDAVVANQLSLANGTVTGTVTGPLVEGTKDDALAVLTAVYNRDLTRTVAVGDGANDRPMLKAAGHAIGYKPKAAVKPACDRTVSSMNQLTTVLTAAGYL
ncbi:MAG: phosphoserine phosphatase SerB [halophilic archaeon J07HX5]|nr:MAG: phosphoserine phosphatase SerB [halophilic archaeon J07HX5]